MKQLHIVDSSGWIEYFSGTVVDIGTSLAMEAARHPLPLADSLIYATALRWNAILWTKDEHFKDLHHVRYFPKSPPITDH